MTGVLDFVKRSLIMKSVSMLFPLFAFVLVSFVSGQTRSPHSPVTGGIITLYAGDPTGQSVCLQDNSYGLVIQEGQVRNRCSDLNFNSYLKNGLSTGVEGGRLGRIIDLGTSDDLQKLYGYQETATPGQGFASITVVDGRPSILKDYQARTVQDLNEARSLLDTPASVASAPIKLNHIYVLRITDRFDKLYEQLVKFVVLSFVPDQSVTIRWEQLGRQNSSAISAIRLD
jgi:hypothetical protein